MAERMFIALDLETTGLDAARDSIIEVGAVRFCGSSIVASFTTLVNPQRPIPRQITELTGIRNADVAGAPTIDRVVPELLAFAGSDTAAVIAHNATFDLGFLRAAGVEFPPACLRYPGVWPPSCCQGWPATASASCAASWRFPWWTRTAPSTTPRPVPCFSPCCRQRCAQPPALLHLLLESARATDWSLTPFFAAAAEFQEATGWRAATPPRWRILR